MFDFHMHSLVSFDGLDPAEKMVRAAADAGLKEICFTDHIDYEIREPKLGMVFDTDRACEMLKDIFGYVCTFEDRKPIFHKL